MEKNKAKNIVNPYLQASCSQRIEQLSEQPVQTQMPGQ